MNADNTELKPNLSQIRVTSVYLWPNHFRDETGKQAGSKRERRHPCLLSTQNPN